MCEFLILNNGVITNSYINNEFVAFINDYSYLKNVNWGSISYIKESTVSDFRSSNLV